MIKGADRDEWVTISKVAVLLSVGTAMAAEVMGVCVCSCGNPRSRVQQEAEC